MLDDLMHALSAPRRMAWSALGLPESGSELVANTTGLDPESPWTHALGLGAEVLGDPLTWALPAAGLAGRAAARGLAGAGGEGAGGLLARALGTPALALEGAGLGGAAADAGADLVTPGAGGLESLLDPVVMARRPRGTPKIDFEAALSGEPMTLGDIASWTGVPRADATERLKNLMELGSLDSLPVKGGVGYRLKGAAPAGAGEVPPAAGEAEAALGQFLGEPAAGTATRGSLPDPVVRGRRPPGTPPVDLEAALSGEGMSLRDLASWTGTPPGEAADRVQEMYARGLLESDATRRGTVRYRLKAAGEVPPAAGEAEAALGQFLGGPGAAPAAGEAEAALGQFLGEPAAGAAGAAETHPELARITREAADADRPLVDRLYDLSGADTTVIDPLYESGDARRVGITHNEYLRRVDAAWKEWERGLKSPADRQRILGQLDRQQGRVANELVPGLRRLAAEGGDRPIDLGQAADWYETHGLGMIDSLRRELGVPASAASFELAGAVPGMGETFTSVAPEAALGQFLGGPGAAPAAALPVGGPGGAVHAAFHALEAGKENHPALLKQVGLGELRRESGRLAGRELSQEEFEQAVRGLRREDLVGMVGSGGRLHTLPQEELDAIIRSGNEVYVGVDRGVSYAAPQAPAPFDPAAHVPALAAAVGKHGRGANLADLADVRSELGHLTRGQQDAVIAQARRQGLVSGSAYEGRGGLTPAQREAQHGLEGDRIGYLSTRGTLG